MTRPAKKKKATKTEQPSAQIPEQQEQPQLPTINVGDLGAAAQFIDVAFRRGAFQASEAAEVGALYNKLAAFVSAYNAEVEAARKNQEEQEQNDE